MISKISSRVGARRIFVVRPDGGVISTPTPTPTATPTPTPSSTETPTATPTSTVTPTPTPTIFIPENDLVYILIPNDDLTYTLIPSNDLIGTFIPNSDLLYTLIPNGELNYILLPDNDLNGIDIPLNDVNYTLIPNSDLTYTLIPNNDLTYNVITETIDLEPIASYLRNHMSDFRNPDFYEYLLDGNGYHINDGGGDMYDDGNVTTPWLISNATYTGDTEYNSIQDFPYAINYQNTSTTSADISFRYISLGYESPNLLPLTVIGTRTSLGTSVGFQCGGNIGADGEGTHVEGNIYTGETVNGYTVHSYYSQTYAAGDPSVCDVFILLGHPDWDSSFGDVFYGGDSSTSGNGSFLYTSGNGVNNILAIKTLLSKQFDAQVTFSEVKTVVDNFILRIYESQGNPPAVFYGLITYSEQPEDCDCSKGGCVSSFYVTGDGPTFCESNNFVTNGDDFAYNGYGYISYNGYYKSVNLNNTNVATYRSACEACPTPTPTPTETPTPTPTETPTPTPTITETPTPTPGNMYVFNAQYGICWDGYGGNYLSIGFSQGGDSIPPQAGWYFIDDNGQVRQITNGGLWFYPGDGPAPNGAGWMAVVDGSFALSCSNPTLTFYPTMPSTPTPTPTSTPTPTPVSHPYEYQIIDRTNITGQFGSDLSLACQALDCLNNSTCTVAGYSNGYFNNETPQIGDSSYNGTTSTVITGLIDGYYIINLGVQYILVEFVSNHIDSVPSCPTPTPTPTATATPTPTPTPTESPLDFTISSDCINGGAVYTNNHIGGSGVYDRGTGLYDTEAEALNDLGWIQISNPSGYVSSGVPYFNTTRTYWVALRDRNNQSNIIAKSILVNCEPTPTPTPTATSTPTPTPTPTNTSTPTETGTPTPTLPPLNFTISGVCQNDGSIRLSDFVGSASNNYQYTGGAHTTENSALNSTFWAPIFGGYIGNVTIGTSGTYWVAVRETENPSNIIAKSVTINCVETSGLVLHYDPSITYSYPGTGTTINDLTGQGRTGTMSNISFTSPYLTFNGTSSQISVPDSLGLEPQGGDFTFEAWIYHSVITGGQRTFMSKTDNGGGASDWSYGLRTNAAGATYLEMGNGTTSVTSPTYTVSAGQWYQIVGVWTNVDSNSITLYVNGVSQGSNSHSFTSVKNSTNSLYLGNYNGNEYQQSFNGRMGVVRMYNKSLTSSEVLGNYNADKSKYGL